MHHLSILLLLSASLILNGCPGNGDGTPAYTTVSCSNMADDSTVNSDNSIQYVISSWQYGSPEYYTFTGSRLEANSANPVTLNYMIHEAIGTPKALLVLIAGGQLNAGLVGTAGDNSPIADYGTGANFLVRSAHLFANNGYKVLTINQPSDAAYYIGINTTKGWAMDQYRASAAHASDLTDMINRANTTNLPVIAIGTSRGAVSVANHYSLFSAIALSNPVTEGSSGNPVTSDQAVGINIPALIIGQQNDGCISTPFNRTMALLNQFPDATGIAITGGYNPPGYNSCGAISYHGFFGIESCTVQQHVDWLDGVVTDL